MRVRIVCYEDVDRWILGKFALKMNQYLMQVGIDSDISKVPDPKADINHHIIYYSYNGEINSIDTVMITHIDNHNKLTLVKKQLMNAAMGICMSQETMEKLVNLGLPRNKLSYINPAHDGIIIPRKKYIGITCRVQEDGRKREFILSKLAKDLNPKLFAFKIMGDGWDAQIKDLKDHGFIVEYTNRFIYDEYIKLIPSLDYYLYTGQDEGQMGFIDALAAGVETIVTPQGYHLDAKDGISYSFTTYDELLSIFNRITMQRMHLIDSVATWNWEDYTIKHIEIWNYLISKRNGSKYFKPEIHYNDGLNSVYKFSRNAVKIYSKNDIRKISFDLYMANFGHFYFKKKNKIVNIIQKEGYLNLFKKVIKKLF